jgi:hypothetical protein
MSIVLLSFGGFYISFIAACEYSYYEFLVSISSVILFFPMP